ncbi:MAG: non-homologous end-joining DNA ligase [Firmicutes bacterium]|nr:non-homologous end-joining DNA ligase [Bacillota bacterium]
MAGGTEAAPAGPGGTLEFGRVEPMLAETAPGPFDDDGWLFEVKWDGYRAIAFLESAGTGVAGDGRTRLQSRQRRDLTPVYPSLTSLHRHLDGRRAVLDGEIIALRDGRPDFQTLQARAGPVVYVAFDLLELDGRLLLSSPLAERRRLLEERVKAGPDLLVSVGVPGRGRDLYHAAVAEGLEGTVGKRLESPYRPGCRSRDWLKVRNVRRALAVVCGFTRAADARPLGALVLGATDHLGRLVYVGHVGTGFDAAEASRLVSILVPGPCPLDGGGPPELAGKVVWVRPERVAEVECLEQTRDGRLRHPVYRGLRPDKDPADCRAPAAPCPSS